MVLAIFFDYLRNFLLFLLGTLLGIRGVVLDTGHGVLDLRPGLFTIHDYFRLRTITLSWMVASKRSPTAKWSASRSSAGRVI